jgi:hypothetical protein
VQGIDARIELARQPGEQAERPAEQHDVARHANRAPRLGDSSSPIASRRCGSAGRASQLGGDRVRPASDTSESRAPSRAAKPCASSASAIASGIAAQRAVSSVSVCARNSGGRSVASRSRARRPPGSTSRLPGADPPGRSRARAPAHCASISVRRRVPAASGSLRS